MKKLSEKDRILHQQFSEYGKNSREWMRKCVLLLPAIEKNRVWEKKGFGSIYEYVAKLAGMSHERVNEGLRVLKKIEDKPELLKIAEQKGINILKPIVNLVDNEESEKFWAEKAKIMSQHTLEAYSRAIRTDNGLRAEAKNQPENLFENRINNEPEKVEIKMLVSPEMAGKLRKLKGDKEWENLMEQFLKLREEKLEQERLEIAKREQEKMAEIRGEKELPFKAKSRYIPARIKNFVIKKTEGRCAFPGCPKPGKILHHTERFEFNRLHDPEKIAPLCVEHERIAHLGLIENEEKSAENWRILRRADRNQLKFVVDCEVAEYRK